MLTPSSRYEIPTRPTDDARRRRRGRCAVDCVVQGLPASGLNPPPEMATRYGARTTVLDWRERLVCSRCGSRQIDMVVSGTKRR
jgi:hypothetical protein